MKYFVVTLALLLFEVSFNTAYSISKIELKQNSTAEKPALADTILHGAIGKRLAKLLENSTSEMTLKKIIAHGEDAAGKPTNLPASKVHKRHRRSHGMINIDDLLDTFYQPGDDMDESVDIVDQDVVQKLEDVIDELERNLLGNDEDSSNEEPLENSEDVENLLHNIENVLSNIFKKGNAGTEPTVDSGLSENNDTSSVDDKDTNKKNESATDMDELMKNKIEPLIEKEVAKQIVEYFKTHKNDTDKQEDNDKDSTDPKPAEDNENDKGSVFKEDPNKNKTTDDAEKDSSDKTDPKQPEEQDVATTTPSEEDKNNKKIEEMVTKILSQAISSIFKLAKENNTAGSQANDTPAPSTNGEPSENATSESTNETDPSTESSPTDTSENSTANSTPDNATDQPESESSDGTPAADSAVESENPTTDAAETS